MGRGGVWSLEKKCIYFSDKNEKRIRIDDIYNGFMGVGGGGGEGGGGGNAFLNLCKNAFAFAIKCKNAFDFAIKNRTSKTHLILR